MNKRIEELADKANAWYPMGYPSGEGGDAAWENLVIFEKEDLEKFAESLIEECIQVLKDTGYPNAHGNCVGVEELKQHFELNEIKPPA